MVPHVGEYLALDAKSAKQQKNTVYCQLHLLWVQQ